VALARPLARLFPGEIQRRLVELRQAIHRHPELAFEEHETARRLAAALEELGPVANEPVAQTGVVARFAGRDRKAPVVAIRGDIDALPITEETGLPYASVRPGVMHACGHDVHATWTVGAAYLLSRQPARGDVLVLLQPAEETGKGAPAVLAAGVLDGVATIFGAHVDRRLPLGNVVAQAGPLAASSDTFAITLRGSGAHAARPHEATDPIVGAGALIVALQSIVSRSTDPTVPAVLTVGSVHAGAAANVIPDAAALTGTVRAVDPQTRQLVHAAVRRVTQGIAAAHGLRADVTIELGPPPIVNPPGPAAWARRAVENVLGPAALVPLGFTNLAAEDFACYLERMPGCFLRIGAREEDGRAIPAHSSRFYAAEESIFIGAAVLAESARVASDALLGA
jgi:hippurate hydrolase